MVQTNNNQEEIFKIAVEGKNKTDQINRLIDNSYIILKNQISLSIGKPVLKINSYDSYKKNLMNKIRKEINFKLNKFTNRRVIISQIY
jgi:hypothetical protein